MKRFFGIRMIIVVTAMWLAVPGAFPARANETAPRPEVRAFWVDAFHDGVKTPAQIDKLVSDAIKANINTLVVQVRRRGDAYYNISPLEPRTQDPVLPPGFDALQYLIEKAHANNIEVHAWLNTLVAWNSSTPPTAPNHVWNLHGPQATGEDNWVSYYRTYNWTTRTWSQKVYSSYYLDPGNPAALDFTVDVYLNIVKNYAVDGIHLDYSRYAGQGWGYNPTSLARYNARFGTTGMPSPDDPQWSQWRREQTADLMRKIYLKAIAVNPKIKVTSATIAWGAGPVAEGDWPASRAYNEVFQDWQGWLQEGIIDIAMPMNYDREWNTAQRLWYDQWIEWEKNHQYNRQVTVGPAIYLQYIEQSLAQISRAQTPSTLGNYAAGVSLYAYASSNLYATDDYANPNSPGAKGLPRQPHVFRPETNEWFYQLLSQPGGYTDPVYGTFIPTEPVFPTSAAIPDMPWKSSPTKGFLMGTVADFTGKTYDHLKVTIIGPETREVYADGYGWFGAADLIPGHYKVSIGKDDFVGRRQINAWVEPGEVAEANFEQFWQKGLSGFGQEKLEIDNTVEPPDPFNEVGSNAKD